MKEMLFFLSNNCLPLNFSIIQVSTYDFVKGNIQTLCYF